MRGDNADPGAMFSYIRPTQRVPQDHPLRAIRAMTDSVLQALSPEFDRLYSRVGRPSIPPERLMRASLLQYLYGIRRERLLMEQLDYNLLFRWFVGLEMDDPVWDASTFSKNRERLLAGDIGRRFLEETVAQARDAGLTSDEHFSVDGTVLEARASHKSFQKKDGSDDDRGGGGGGGRNRHVDFRGEPRKNDTHQSTTDPDARMYTKGPHQGAKLSYLGHIVIENRNGLVMAAEVTFADGTHRERQAASRLMADTPRRTEATVGADKGYDTAGFVASMREQGVTPHVAPEHNQAAKRDRRTYHTARRLRCEPDCPQDRRASLRMAQERGWSVASEIPGSRSSRSDLHLRNGRVQTGEIAESPAGARLTAPTAVRPRSQASNQHPRITS